MRKRADREKQRGKEQMGTGAERERAECGKSRRGKSRWKKSR